MNSKTNNREEIAKALILCANAYLAMDSDSSAEEFDGNIFDSDDDTDDCPPPTKICKFDTLTVPKWQGDEYMTNLKMSAETFDFVYKLVAPSLCRQCYGTPMVDARLQLMVALRKLTSSDTYGDASAAFNMTRSTGYICTKRVVDVLNGFAPAIIQWLTEDAAKPSGLSGFPGVLGNVGRCRLQLLDFLEKDRDGVIFQVICDSKQKILHWDISSANTDPLSTLPHLSDPKKIPHNTHLIANNSYPLHENIMVPYTEENSDIKKNFNKKIQSAFVIEDCLGSLLGRFETLRRGLSKNQNTNKKHVTACCVLHNICVAKNDPCEMAKVDFVTEKSSSSCPKGVKKRDAIACELWGDGKR